MLKNYIISSLLYRRSISNISYVKKKKFVTFEEMIESRRREARRSIIVQVQSEDSCHDLHKYCKSMIGQVENLFYYSIQSGNYALVEFSESAGNITSKCSHNRRQSDSIGPPVASPIVWFRAVKPDGRDRVKKRQTTVEEDEKNSGTQLLERLTEISISDGMKLIYERTKLDEVGTRLRFVTARQLELSMSGLFPDCAVLPFGSSVNGFGRLGSDLDLVFQHSFKRNNDDSKGRLVHLCKINSTGSMRVHIQRQMEVIADLIQVYLPGCSSVKRILQATVPIVKYTSDYSALECDVSLGNLTGIYMSELLYLFGEFSESVRPLVSTLRLWARTNGITHSSPGKWITNFTLTLMAIHYLQSVDVLPHLDELKKHSIQDDIRLTEDIDCTFCRDLNRFPGSANRRQSPDLDSLLIGFFDYFSNFNFDSFSVTFGSKGKFMKSDNSPIFLSNPFQPWINVARNVDMKNLQAIRSKVMESKYNLSVSSSLSLISILGQGTDDKSQLDKFKYPNRIITVKELFNF